MTDRGLKQLKEPLRQVQKEIGTLLGLLERGGPGSGHHGHAGRPGEVGGSLPSGQAKAVESYDPLSTNRFVALWHDRDVEAEIQNRIAGFLTEIEQETGYRLEDVAFTADALEIAKFANEEWVEEKYELGWTDDHIRDVVGQALEESVMGFARHEKTGGKLIYINATSNYFPGPSTWLFDYYLVHEIGHEIQRELGIENHPFGLNPPEDYVNRVLGYSDEDMDDEYRSDLFASYFAGPDPTTGAFSWGSRSATEDEYGFPRVEPPIKQTDDEISKADELIELIRDQVAEGSYVERANEKPKDEPFIIKGPPDGLHEGINQSPEGTDCQVIDDEYLDAIADRLIERGGPGSGHHGHAGRPGEIGGSLPSGAVAQVSDDVRAGRKKMLHDLYKRLPDSGKLRQSEKAQEYLEAATTWFLDREVTVSFEEIDSINRAKGFRLRDDGGNILAVQIGEGMWTGHETELILSWIDANNKGTGLGSAFMRACKSYADGKKMPFRIIQITNPKFYRRFDWLVDKGFVDGFLYKPPTMVDRAEPDTGDDDLEDYDLTESPHHPDGRKWPPEVPVIERHYGPGPHPGTGTPQDVHAGLRGTGYFSWQDRYIEHIPKHMGKRDIPEGMMYQPARWLGLHSEGFGDVFRELAKAHDYTGGRVDWSYIEEKIHRFEKDISYERDREWIFEGEISPADEARRQEMLTLWREFPGAMPPALEVARQLNLRLLERDYTGVILAISDVRAFQKSGALLIRHYGPGPHPGTGTSQDVHGGGRGYRKIPFDRTYETGPTGLRRLAKKEQQETGEFRWAYWDLSDPDDPHTKMFENKEAAMEFIADKIRKLDYEIHYSFSDATMIFKHTQNDPHRVTFNRQNILALIELSKKPENTNIINMHNHPPTKSGIDIPPSFSDFNFAMNRQKTDEWWVITPNGKYVATREERGIPFFSGSDVYQLENDWNRWTEQNVEKYFPGYGPRESIQLKASRDPEAGEKFVEMRMELIQKEVEDGGYFDVEWIPNE